MAVKHSNAHIEPADFTQVITIYGRKPVLEALRDPDMRCSTLHWAKSNKASGAAGELLTLARRREIAVREHTRDTLSRISRNGKQDQGVALDIHCPSFGDVESLDMATLGVADRFLALDGITNPQNVGMIIRSAVAAGMRGIIYPRKGVASLGPLVIKASVGTVFKAPILPCPALPAALQTLKSKGLAVVCLAGDGDQSLFTHQQEAPTVYVMGGETDGVTAEIARLADARLQIPMAGGVESLNVAVAASLVAFAGHLGTGINH